ncbi:AsnC family transcriptional regulator [Hallella multisaccharivorax DSM 17128]|uniref:Transcriptional regulator, AsnC family n=1 Tax=Hallella multisaccharivorax DSM 17128 TaxID=688246 RepID=F8N754_9BACT|nr:Lrp/AsnC family transcriptional regulator [Hallella multisaccharivorax]EGN57370.1 transcriptional regulator, AsnC family [Hallella multisaccharivorax DSM 17128]GJG31391.1 AsnC family transcriptional regulator [Hallella multisaccharivorax DSM 17128]
MANTETFDDTDRRILQLLQKDSRMTIKELAARVHLSPSPTFERQKRLERLGYIERYMAVVNPQKVGNGILVLCNIRLKQHTQALIREFMDAVQSIDEITECYNTSGDFDFLIKVYTKDMKAYQQFMLNTLGTIPCVGSLNSIFVIDHTKSTRGVPIPENETPKG